MFWGAAALFVVLANRTFAPVSLGATVVAKVVVIVLAAFAYIREVERECTVDRALVVGAAWLLLSIVTELIAAAWTGRPWFELLGSPAAPCGRDALMFVWVAATAAFARYQC